ncbi:Sec-independent protein translocase protein TatB [Roseibium aestuarii]|uniref:Sec-independent protein translocase protein TatB n=1 Tax=Roseibium aestuarii TaxID=2600299 RepID=A0ABW4JS61_9HYPH|nr:Sec-independent protein translocase protein TatB [Roseibium aestuarii]
MFDIGWTEILVIVCVMIIVVGPKDLPRMLRTIGQTIGKVRRMSREFQSTFNDAIREAEKQADIADMKKQVEAVGNFNPLGDLKKSIEEDKAKTAVGDKVAAATTPAPAAPAIPPAPEASAATPVATEASAVSVEAPAAAPVAPAAPVPAAEDTKA